MRTTSLSISSINSQSSVSSSTDRENNTSPRRGLLSNSSPILSPGLPSLLSQHGSSSKRRRHATKSCRNGKAIISVLGILLISYYLIHQFVLSHGDQKKINYDLVDQTHLPEEPSAIIVDDLRHRKKWTVWIPPQSSFPLRPWEYAEICAQTEQIQLEISGGSSLFGKKKGYHHKDPSYVDVGKAFDLGLLPKTSKIINHADDLDGRKICERTMTFVMETDDAGMGNTLLALWLAYGLARKEGRSFFVDDTHWPYGKYSTYFKQPPDAGCRPPPANYRVPCPRQAAHLVISAATFPHVYGPAFQSRFLDKSQSPQFQHRRIHKLMHVGYQALFHLADPDDAAYLEDRVRGKTFQEAHHGGGMTVGLHIRRGDVHPWEKEFEADYIPVNHYMNEVREILITTYEHDDEENNGSPPHAQKMDHASRIKTISVSLKSWITAIRVKVMELSPSVTPLSHTVFKLHKRHGPAGLMASKVLLASDDPMIYHAPELSRAIRAQDRIVLASKADLEHIAPTPKGPIDRINGWEGGFYQSQFFSLGMSDSMTPKPPPRPHLQGRRTESDVHETINKAIHAASASLPAYDPWRRSRTSDLPPSKKALAMRSIVGRAYLLDIAVLGQADAVVCAVSSAACRVLGVMQGWDKITGGAWRNVDGHLGWKGVIVE